MKTSRWWIVGMALGSVAIAPEPAAGQWIVDTIVDAMTDEVRVVASVTNDDGFRFALYRVDETLEANFRIPDKNLDLLSPSRLPVYRIDQHDAQDLQFMLTAQQYVQFQIYEWEPKWINFRFWHGVEAEGRNQDLINLLDGEQLLFRYYLDTGGYIETAFSVAGAREALYHLGIR